MHSEVYTPKQNVIYSHLSGSNKHNVAHMDWKHGHQTNPGGGGGGGAMFNGFPGARWPLRQFSKSDATRILGILQVCELWWE